MGESGSVRWSAWLVGQHRWSADKDESKQTVLTVRLARDPASLAAKLGGEWLKMGSRTQNLRGRSVDDRLVFRCPTRLRSVASYKMMECESTTKELCASHTKSTLKNPLMCLPTHPHSWGVPSLSRRVLSVTLPPSGRVGRLALL